MMSLTFGLFTQVSGSGPLGPLVVGFEETYSYHTDYPEAANAIENNRHYWNQ